MAFKGEGNGISMLMDVIPEIHDPSQSDRVDINKIEYDFKGKL